MPGALQFTKHPLHTQPLPPNLILKANPWASVAPFLGFRGQKSPFPSLASFCRVAKFDKNVICQLYRVITSNVSSQSWAGLVIILRHH